MRSLPEVICLFLELQRGVLLETVSSEWAHTEPRCCPAPRGPFTPRWKLCPSLGRRRKLTVRSRAATCPASCTWLMCGRAGRCVCSSNLAPPQSHPREDAPKPVLSTTQVVCIQTFQCRSTPDHPLLLLRFHFSAQEIPKPQKARCSTVGRNCHTTSDGGRADVNALPKVAQLVSGGADLWPRGV